MKLGFDSTLNKLNFNVMFTFILLLLITRSFSYGPLCECPSQKRRGREMSQSSAPGKRIHFFASLSGH